MTAIDADTTDPVGEIPTDSPAELAADRTLLLECRLEQLVSALAEARAGADLARARLAEAAAREADHARRQALLQAELATAREEVADLHQRLDHSEALRAELEGHFSEAGSRDDAKELIRLRRDATAARQEKRAHERTTAYLRARVDELVANREVLLTRVVEWQSSIRQGDRDAVDLGEFIAALRRDILELEHRNVVGERREADLRRQLLEVSNDGEGDTEPPDTPASREQPETGAVTMPETARPTGPTEPLSAAAGDLVAALDTADNPESRIDLLLRLGRCGEPGVFYAIRRWAGATDPGVRAAAFQALGRVLERDPGRLEPHIRWGTADPDPRVRRRVILAAATARGLDLRTLLEPLRADQDPQVRRVVNEVLRRPPSAGPGNDLHTLSRYATRRTAPSTTGAAS